MIVVLDTSVISAFVKIGKFDLLRKLLEKNMVLIPDTVFREIIHEEALDALAFSEEELNNKGKWILVEQVDISDVKNNLGYGEKGTIKLAKSRDAVAVIDDSNARKNALEYGLKITGTLGLLCSALEEQIISRSELKRILNDLRIKDDFRISEGLMKNMLK